MQDTQMRNTTNGYRIETIHFRSGDGTSIAASRMGPPDGLPVCLLHGGGQTRHSWGKTLETLADLGFLALTVDLRGHGDSDWSAQARYEVEDYVEDIRSVVSSLQRPPILVGASLGGIASVLAAGEAPSVAIGGLALVDVSAYMRPEGSRAILDFMLGTAGGFGSIGEAAEAVAQYLPHRPRAPQHEGLWKNLREHPDGRLRWHWDPNAFSRPFNREGVSQRMCAAAANVGAPVVLLRGEFSELVLHDSADAFIAHFERGEVVDIPGAHHMVAGDRNDQFNDELVSFVCGVRAVDSA